MINAPDKNSFKVKGVLETIPQIVLAKPQIILPIIIDIIKERQIFKKKLRCIFVKIFNNNPEQRPYVASSNAMASARGYNGGIPKNSDLVSGKINPINIPYQGPMIKPAKKTGICIGQSIFPTVGI